jgi:transposase
MSPRFRNCSLDQPFLMPPSMHEWLPKEHLARFIADITDHLNLKPILDKYSRQDNRGAQAYHPLMLVRLLLYGYCTGIVSSRELERATESHVAFRYLAANEHPDHDTIANFRRMHLTELGELFTQGLELCREAGLVKAGRVMLDGTKIAANASRRKNMTHEQLSKREEALQQKVAEMLREAETTDGAEDQRYGKGKRGDELPKELSDPQKRLKRIQEAKTRLEERLKRTAEEAERERAEQKASGEAQTNAQKKRFYRARKAAAEQQGTINLTDAESRLMVNGNVGGYVQAYNAQAAVLENQVIVAAEVTNEAADKQQLVPMTAKIIEGLGCAPTTVMADSGYFSEPAVGDESLKGIETLVPPDRCKPGEELKEKSPRGEQAMKMREKLARTDVAAEYGLRKQTIEPVFGQIKEARGFRRFLMRGAEAVRTEWRLMALTHNLLKLYRHRMQANVAVALA